MHLSVMMCCISDLVQVGLYNYRYFVVLIYASTFFLMQRLGFFFGPETEPVGVHNGATVQVPLRDPVPLWPRGGDWKLFDPLCHTWPEFYRQRTSLAQSMVF